MNLRQHKISTKTRSLEVIFHYFAISQSNQSLKKVQSYKMRLKKLKWKERNQVKDSISSILKSTMPNYFLKYRRTPTLFMQFLNIIMIKMGSQLPLANKKTITLYSGTNYPTDLSFPKVSPIWKSKSLTKTFTNYKMIFQALVSWK